MKQLALEALDAATNPAVTYADTRVMEIRDRQVSTKNGKAGHVSSSVSMGLAIRVLADGCWGFAATNPAVTYADTRVMEIRDRQVSTKNGKAGHVSSSVSMGLAIRVLADGCWG